MKRYGVVTAAALLLSACGGGATSGNAPPQSAGQRPARNTHRDTVAGPIVPRPDAESGQLGGRDAAALIRMFGDPRLDMHEGTAHKLQFANDRCVLDAYLYPAREGAEPVVTHVDARALDGSDVDSAACIQTLQRR